MSKESGEWMIHGLDWDEPDCLHTLEEAMAYINTVGFLPLFQNEIPGFSLEERTAPECWWSEDPQRDPWIWREIIAGRHDIIYGKFFAKKAGFISRDWIPVFANYRRDGYDFDALYEDGKAPFKAKKIMEHFMEDRAEAELFSSDLKKRSGFGKGGESGFEAAVIGLMMQLYLCNCDFRQRRNKRGEGYGWQVAVYSTPEHLYGYEAVTACYGEPPQKSWERILAHVCKLYPSATDQQIKKVLK